MFNLVFLFIMLLAFKHTHLIPDSDVFLCIFLDLLSFCPPIVFFDNPGLRDDVLSMSVIPLC